MTDRQLYQLCKKFGRRALEARRKFVGLLPEVFRRRLWERRGFVSIYELAAKLAGLGRDQVDEVLRLERRYVSMPVLHQALVNGEIGVTKLARVAAVATPENAESLLAAAKIYSYAALNIKVKEIKAAQEVEKRIENGFSEPENGVKSLCAQTLAEMGIGREVAEKLEMLKAKGFDLNQLLGDLLEKREKGIAEEEERLNRQMAVPRSRYIPLRVKKILLAKNGRGCEGGNCGRLFEHFHHQKEFAQGGWHRPDNLELLCRGHHELRHKKAPR